MAISVNAPSQAPANAPRPAGQIEIAAPLEEGSRIGPYEVREHIGDGGMAAVYKVWHTGLHRFEALKIPRYQASRGPEADFLHRLLAEARTAASLQHPHIVGIYNVSDEKSILHYFSMEFVDGDDLASLIVNGPLPFEETLAILRQIGSALDYAHANGVVHRDIKPANILLERTPSGDRARVVDFGISRAGEDDGSTRLTRSGMIVGTPEYMSPEQSGSGAPVDHRTDIYSLGVVAYEMLCGAPPFVAGDGVSRMSVLMKQINQVPPPLDHCRPDLSPAAAHAVARALAKDPEERFASCEEFLEALAAVPPLAEQQSALLASGVKPLRRTVGALFGSPTLSANEKSQTRSQTLSVGEQTASHEAPLPAKIARAATSPLVLLAGIIGLSAGALMVWNLRETPTTALIKPESTPTIVKPVVPPQPTIAPKPTTQSTAQPTAKPTAQPTRKPNPTPVRTPTRKVAAKITRKARAAKPLQKPKPRPKVVRKPVTRKPTRHISRKPVVRKPIRISRRRPVIKKRPATRRTVRSGGEAGLPP
jgi:serine/threonine protein kinase